MFRSMLFRVICFLICAFLGVAGTLLAQTVGTTTADILKINDGARPAALGGAYTAMGDDAYAVNYNPAGLSYIKASQLVVMHLDSLANIEYEYLTFATTWGSTVLAFNATYQHEPPIDNQNGNPAVNADELVASLSGAFKLSNSIRAGATAKFVQSDFASFSASTIAFDAGLVVDKLPYGIRAGLAVQNVGPGMTFDQAANISDPLPLFIRFGLGTHQIIDGNKDLNIGLEVFKPSDQDIKMGLGGEFWVFPGLLGIRGGYKFEGLGTPTGNVFQDYTLGATLTRDIDGDDFSLDIAYDPADFGSTSEDTFFFALNLKFNQLRIL